MTALSIDPPRIEPGESLCVHDMLAGTCSICLGLPDVPTLDELGTSGPDSFTSLSRPSVRRLKWVPLVSPIDCERCGGEVKARQLATWSDEFGGYVGRCCEDYL